MTLKFNLSREADRRSYESLEGKPSLRRSSLGFYLATGKQNIPVTYDTYPVLEEKLILVDDVLRRFYYKNPSDPTISLYNENDPPAGAVFPCVKLLQKKLGSKVLMVLNTDEIVTDVIASEPVPDNLCLPAISFDFMSDILNDPVLDIMDTIKIVDYEFYGGSKTPTDANKKIKCYVTKHINHNIKSHKNAVVMMEHNDNHEKDTGIFLVTLPNKYTYLFTIANQKSVAVWFSNPVKTIKEAVKLLPLGKK